MGQQFKFSCCIQTPSIQAGAGRVRNLTIIVSAHAHGDESAYKFALGAHELLVRWPSVGVSYNHGRSKFPIQEPLYGI